MRSVDVSVEPITLRGAVPLGGLFGSQGLDRPSMGR